MLNAIIICDDESLERLLEDALEEVAVAIATDERPDVIIAVVGRPPLEDVFARARASATAAPIVAVMAYYDEVTARRARELGARVIVALDEGLDELRWAVERAVLGDDRHPLAATL